MEISRTSAPSARVLKNISKENCKTAQRPPEALRRLAGRVAGFY